MLPVCCNVLAKWIRLACLVIFFAVVLFSLPVHLKYDGASAQGFGRLQTQGPPSHNLPNIDETRGIEPGAPKAMPKEYGRSVWSLVPAQSFSVVSINPGANQTPDPGQGGAAVSSWSNLGHGSTQSLVSRIAQSGSSVQTKTCLWHSFSNVPGTKTRVTLKFDWTLNASIDASAENSISGADASYNFRIEYSLNNGSTWTVRGGANDSVTVPQGAGPGSDGDFINTSGSESVDLPNPGAIDITQIRVRDRISASVTVRGAGGEASSDATASVSSISLEVETVNCFANVPGDQWKGEYYNNTTLTGSPALVRNDSIPGTNFLDINFGSGSPSSACGLGADNFSARWTRTVYFAAAGTYRFTATVDDGARLYVAGQLTEINHLAGPPNTYTTDVALTAGYHEIKLEFVEYGGWANISLSWADATGVNCLPNTPLPLISSVPQTSGGKNIASTAPSQAPKRCGQKIVTAPRAPTSD